MTPDTKLRYYALKAMQIINALRAYDGYGIPQSDAILAFDLLQEIVRSELNPKEQSFDANHLPEIRVLSEELRKCPAG